MKNFNRGDRSGGRGGFGGRGGKGGFNRRDGGGRPEMHSAVCDQCGKDCEVPFRPTGDKPVFCSDCFSSKGSGGSSRFGGRDSRGGRDDRREKRMFSAVCDKCGKNCEVPFQPSGDKPVYCSDCFGNKSHDAGESKGPSQNKEEFAKLHSKLDKILQALNISVPVEVKAEKKAEIKKEQKETVIEEKNPKPKKEKKEVKITKIKEAKKDASVSFKAGKKATKRKK